LPLSWTTFGELAPAGILLTVLALPAFTFLSVVAWAGALVPWAALAPPAELAARVFYGILELGDALPGTPLVLPPRPAALLALATALTFVAVRRRGTWAGRLACLAWSALLVPWSAAPRGLELVALDVGHGTAVVARAPGLEALVFDAGSRDRRGVAGEALIPLLAAWEVAHPTVVLSHVHLDHASGLARLAERFPLEAWLGAAPAQAGVRLPHAVRRADIGRGRLALSTACPELSMVLLRGSDEPGNEGSRALELGWRGARLLLLGDAEEDGLTGLALAPGPLRLLLAPHHGAEAPGLAALFARNPPAEVWISAGRRAPLAAELERRRLRWRWTARDGFLALGLP
jgi:beta-lactamase superfamily II metal-dependent hydrolase